MLNFYEFIYLILLHYLSSHVQGVPVNSEDTWDYKNHFNNTPLVIVTKNHILPPEYNNMEHTQTSEEEIQEKKIHFPPFIEEKLKLLNLKQVVYEIENSALSNISCNACKAGVGLLQHYIQTGKTEEEIKQKFIRFCNSLKIQSTNVCEGITQAFANELYYVLNNSKLGPEEICGFVIGEACDDVHNPIHEWEVVFPPIPKPTLPVLQLRQVDAPTFKVLHLSDTHYDPHYIEGSNADCSEPLCCRAVNGIPKTKDQAAGKWGDYRKCDTPKVTIEHMLNHIAQTHPDIDYIIWTGDLPPHDIWNQSREGNLQVLKDTVQQMFTFFPGIPIFPALGNHEASPVNSFPSSAILTPDNSINWLYDELDVQWRKWLPSIVSNTVQRGGFYSVLVSPGFRIISLNMNFCSNLNWWLILNSTDPASELQWFIYELQLAELNGEKVHVIGHIPPGYSDCVKVWSRNYNAIINRYELTITGQFFGHTHRDEFEVFYDNDDLDRAISIAYIGPSVSPYSNLNPGYRLYYVDGNHELSTRAVVDHETWIMNLREANLYGYPIWFKLYSARTSYQMDSLRPQDWHELIERMKGDSSMFDTFYRYHYKDSPVRPNCDVNCKKQLLCDLRSGKSNDRKKLCKNDEPILDVTENSTQRQWFYNICLPENKTTSPSPAVQLVDLDNGISCSKIIQPSNVILVIIVYFILKL